jgi:hypothetical protein
MRIADLATGIHRPAGPRPDVNPLREDDALQEAQLLGVWLDALMGAAALLFELRVALQLHETNTGVLLARGVRRLAWSGPERATSRTAWTVGGSKVAASDGLLHLDLGLWPSPGAHLQLAAEEASFVTGDVPGLGETPPDYLEDDEETIRSSLPSWDSPFSIVSVASPEG